MSGLEGVQAANLRRLVLNALNHHAGILRALLDDENLGVGKDFLSRDIRNRLEDVNGAIGRAEKVRDLEIGYLIPDIAPILREALETYIEGLKKAKSSTLEKWQTKGKLESTDAEIEQAEMLKTKIS